MTFKDYWLLKENPDIVLGTQGQKYVRDEFAYDLFIGNGDGAVVINKDLSGLTNHGEVLGWLKENHFLKIEKEALEEERYKIVKVPEGKGINLVGSPKFVHTKYSGIILPKQEANDGTYISYWYEVGSEKGSLNELLMSYAKDRYEGPYFVEVTNGASCPGSALYDERGVSFGCR